MLALGLYREADMLDGDSPDIILAKPPCVRIASAADAGQIFDLLCIMDDVDNPTGLSKSNAKIRRQIAKGCQGNGGIIGVIDGDDGYLAGTIGIFMQQMWHSDDWFLSALWTFVRPDSRKGTDYGKSLLDFAKWHRSDLSARSGMKLPLDLGWLSSERQEARARLWSRVAKPIGMLHWIEGDTP